MKIIELESRAGQLSVICVILAVIGGLCCVGGLVETEGKGLGTAFVYAAAFFSLAFAAALFSHLNYIRAALEKK
jgi:hypothetical protein